MHLRSLAQSRVVLLVGVVVSVLVPVLTLPRLPYLSPGPVLLGVAPWVVGKYVLCPLRWRVLTSEPRSRWWHVRAYAEGELLGLLTPAHVGADVWRVHRLTRTGLGRGDAVLSVGADRLVGAVGLACSSCSPVRRSRCRGRCCRAASRCSPWSRRWWFAVPGPTSSRGGLSLHHAGSPRPSCSRPATSSPSPPC